MIRGAASLDELQFFHLAHGEGTDFIFETFGLIKRRKYLIPSTDGKAVILISSSGLVSQDFCILAGEGS